jgi:hypothetical protein
MSGMSVGDSAVRALSTSGRAVLFAGLTVIIALLGMFALGLSFLNGMAIGAALTVAMTVLAAITLLPALLGLMKLRVLSRKQRKQLAVRHAARAWQDAQSAQSGYQVTPAYDEVGSQEAAPIRSRWRSRSGSAAPAAVTASATPFADADNGFFTRWAHRVQAKPLAKAVLAIAVMVVVALPRLLAPPRHLRRGQRPRVLDHPPGLRPAGEGLRPGVQRPADAGRADPGGGRPDRTDAPGRPAGRHPGRGARDPDADEAGADDRCGERHPDDVAGVGADHRPDQAPAL